MQNFHEWVNVVCSSRHSPCPTNANIVVMSPTCILAPPLSREIALLFLRHSRKLEIGSFSTVGFVMGSACSTLSLRFRLAKFQTSLYVKLLCFYIHNGRSFFYSSQLFVWSFLESWRDSSGFHKVFLEFCLPYLTSMLFSCVVSRSPVSSVSLFYFLFKFGYFLSTFVFACQRTCTHSFNFSVLCPLAIRNLRYIGSLNSN